VLVDFEAVFDMLYVGMFISVKVFMCLTPGIYALSLSNEKLVDASPHVVILH